MTALWRSDHGRSSGRPRKRRIVTARSKLCLGCRRISLEEPGVVVDRGIEFVVAVVKPELGLALRIKIDCAAQPTAAARPRYAKGGLSPLSTVIFTWPEPCSIGTSISSETTVVPPRFIRTRVISPLAP